MSTKTKKLTPQAQLVWDYLKSGRALTNLIATTTLRVSSVSRRMTEVTRNDEVHAYLQAAGKEITKTWGEDHMLKRYIKYQMVEKAGAPTSE